MKVHSIVFFAALAASGWQQAVSVFDDDFNIPVTVRVPSGYASNTVRLHLASYGTVPYGEAFDSVEVIHYPHNCMCGNFPCYTGCGSFASAPDNCRIPIRANQFTAFLVEETGGDVDDGCSRAQRSFNVAQAGGFAAIIVAAPNTTDLLSAVDSQDAVAAIETLQYLEHVDMPIGVVNHTQGVWLEARVEEAESKGEKPRIKLDFRHERMAGKVVLNVWHDTDDDCGVLCHDVHAFMNDLGRMAQAFAPGNPISIVPRYIYQQCPSNETSSDSCKRGCVNDGRYCTLRGSRSARAPGGMVTQENIRQACLYDALSKNPKNIRQFWHYKRLFQVHCRSQAGTFNAKCSDEQFAELTLEAADVVRAAWNNCTAPLNNGAMNIPIADKDRDGLGSQKVSLRLQATVVVAQPQPHISHHYKGELDSVHVIKAACSALDNTTRSSVKICDRLTQGRCHPGGAGDIACRSQANQQKHTTQCTEVDTALGYDCACTPGFTEVANDEGVRSCQNRNECAEFPSLCGRFTNTRNACQDRAPGFECIEDLPLECSAEKNWAGCWTGESQGVTYHSCEDLVAKVRFDLQEGSNDRGPLSRCNCEFIEGCWAGGTGDCFERCPIEKCNVISKMCDGDAGLSTAGVVGISLSVILVAAVVAAVAFYVIRRRKARLDPAKGVVSSYNNFRDGMDADEMARSQAVEAYVASAAPGDTMSDAFGNGKIPHGVSPLPPNGEALGERPPTFAAQNSFVGSLTIQEQEPHPQS